MPTGLQDANRLVEISRQARCFRDRLRLRLAGRGALTCGAAGAWGAGLLMLAGRLAGQHGSVAERLLFLFAVAGIVALAGGALAARRSPPLAAVLAAIDAANSAGGLVMCAGTDGASAWPVAVNRLPGIVWNASRATGGLALAMLFGLTTLLLPARFFAGTTRPATQGLGALVEELAERVSQAESENLLPEPLVAALSNQLERIEAGGDAADPARTLEALDHIEEELSKSAAAQAE